MTATLIGIGSIIAAIFAAWITGRRSGKTAAKATTLQQELDAHDRVTKADTGDDMSDADRVVRLRAIAKRLGH